MKLGIVTQQNWILDLNGVSVGASKELKNLGVINFFSTGVGFESVVRYKLDPEGVLLALDNLNTDPADAVLVVDSSSDIKAGNYAGCLTCHAVWGHLSKSEEFTPAKANWVLKTPLEILSLPFNS